MVRINKLATGVVVAIVAVVGFSGVVTAGASPRPKHNLTIVKANSTDVYTIVFKAGEKARVEILGDGDSDLDLYVFDENGNQITKDDDNTDHCICEWTPKWTGKFTLKVVNRGVANRYKMQTN